VGYDAGKKVKGRKRHIVVDTQGLVLNAVHPADIQDCDGALPVLTGLGLPFPWLKLIWADGVYKREGLDALFAEPRPWRLEVVKRSDDTKEFKVLPHRWVVERTFGRMGRSRQLACHYEGLVRTACTYLKIAMMQLMIRHLAIAWNRFKTFDSGSKVSLQSPPTRPRQARSRVSTSDRVKATGETRSR